MHVQGSLVERLFMNDFMRIDEPGWTTPGALIKLDSFNFLIERATLQGFRNPSISGGQVDRKMLYDVIAS